MPADVEKINVRKIAIFLALTFIWAIILGLVPIGMDRKLEGTFIMVLGIIYMLFPALMAILVQKVIYRQPVKQSFRLVMRFNRWTAMGWLVPALIAVAASGIALLLPGVTYAPDMAGMFARYQDVLSPEQITQMKDYLAALPVHPFFLAMAQGLFYGATLNALAALGEEMGWRGFLLRELRSLGFGQASAIIGIIWGLWHAPLIIQGYNYPQHPHVGVLMMTIFCLLWSPLLCFITLKADSVVAAAIAHGTVNGTAGLAIIMIQGGSDLTVGITGLAGLLALVIANLFLYGATGRYRSITY